MGCSSCSNNLEIKNQNIKSFFKYKNISTIEKFDPKLKEDYGTVCLLELENDEFLVSTQCNKIIIYNINIYKIIFVIRLISTVNSIIRMKNGRFVFGDDNGEIQILGMNSNNNYKIFNYFKCENSITKILEYKDDIIVSTYKEILFFNITDKNKFELKKTLKDHLSKIDIFNIYIIKGLLLSFAYEQREGDRNEIIIYNLKKNKIVFKESKASLIPWNNSVCKFNSNLLAIAGNKSEIRLFDIKTFEIIAQILDLDFFYSVFCIKNKILCGSDSGKIYEFEYDPEKNKLTYINEKKIHDSSIFSISRLSSGSFVTTSRDGTIKIFK